MMNLKHFTSTLTKLDTTRQFFSSFFASSLYFYKGCAGIFIIQFQANFFFSLTFKGLKMLFCVSKRECGSVEGKRPFKYLHADN